MTFGCFAGFQGFDCSIMWVMMVLLFFIMAIFRRKVADEALSTNFSLIGATITAVAGFVIVVFITKSFKWSFLAGMILGLVGGFISASFLPDGEGE